MRGPVFSDANRIVRKHIDDGNLHDRSQTHGRSRVIAEDQEAGTEWSNLAERKPVQNRAHGVLAYAEVKISAVVASSFEIARAIECKTRLSGGRQVSRAADQPGNILGQHIQHLGG